MRALTYGPMDEQVREGGNGSERVALTNWKVQRDSQVRKGGREGNGVSNWKVQTDVQQHVTHARQMSDDGYFMCAVPCTVTFQK